METRNKTSTPCLFLTLLFGQLVQKVRSEDKPQQQDGHDEIEPMTESRSEHEAVRKNCNPPQSLERLDFSRFRKMLANA